MGKPHLVNMNMFLQKGQAFPPKLDPKGVKGIVTTESAIGYSKYTARKLADERTHEKVDFAPGGYYDYTNKRFGATRTFTNEGWKDSNSELKQFRNYVAKHFQDDGDILWIPVQSYKDYTTAMQYGLFKDEDYAEITKKSLERFFKYVGLEPDNMIWWMNYHNNKNHPHVHLAYLEKNKTRTKGTFTQKELVQYKRYILTEMKERERLILGTENEAITKLKDMDLERQNIKRTTIELINTKQSKTLNEMIHKLSQELPEKSRLQYGSSQMIPYRDKIDEIVEHILYHVKIRNEYEALKNTWSQLDGEYAEALHENITNISDAEDAKLRKQLANSVLKSIKDKTIPLHEVPEDSVSKFAHENEDEKKSVYHTNDEGSISSEELEKTKLESDVIENSSLYLEQSDDLYNNLSTENYPNLKSNSGYSSSILDSTLSLIKRNAKQNERVLERGREEYLEDGLEKEKRGKSL